MIMESWGKLNENQSDERRAMLASSAIEVHARIHDKLSLLTRESREALVQAFDYVKYNVVPTVDLTQIGVDSATDERVDPLDPNAASTFIERKIVERLANTVPSFVCFVEIQHSLKEELSLNISPERVNVLRKEIKNHFPDIDNRQPHNLTGDIGRVK